MVDVILETIIPKMVNYAKLQDFNIIIGGRGGGEKPVHDQSS